MALFASDQRDSLVCRHPLGRGGVGSVCLAFPLHHPPAGFGFLWGGLGVGAKHFAHPVLDDYADVNHYFDTKPDGDEPSLPYPDRDKDDDGVAQPDPNRDDGRTAQPKSDPDGDGAAQCYPNGDGAAQRYPDGDGAAQCYPDGDEAAQRGPGGNRNAAAESYRFANGHSHAFALVDANGNGYGNAHGYPNAYADGNGDGWTTDKHAYQDGYPNPGDEHTYADADPEHDRYPDLDSFPFDDPDVDRYTDEDDDPNGDRYTDEDDDPDDDRYDNGDGDRYADKDGDRYADRDDDRYPDEDKYAFSYGYSRIHRGSGDCFADSEGNGIPDGQPFTKISRPSPIGRTQFGLLLVGSAAGTARGAGDLCSSGRPTTGTRALIIGGEGTPGTTFFPGAFQPTGKYTHFSRTG